MKTSSEYPVLDNRPIDQWKVTELKEELKRRKLITKGLKEELIKRLDEALRDEEGATVDVNNGVHESDHDVADETDKAEVTVVETGEAGSAVLSNAGESTVVDDGESAKVVVISDQEDTKNKSEQANLGKCVEVNKSELVDDQPATSEILFDDGSAVLMKAGESTVNGDGENAKVVIVSDQEDVKNKSEQSNPSRCLEVKGSELDDDHPDRSEILSAGMDNKVCEKLLLETVTSTQGSQSDEVERANEDLGAQPGSENVTLHVGMKTSTSDSTNQVSEVSVSLGFSINSVSTDSVSVNEKNELKDTIITDDVKLESNVKLEVMQSSSSDLVLDGGESHPEDVDEPQGNKVSVINEDTSRKNHSADLGSSEKLNLDRSSGDDSMEEDALESKQTDSKLNSEEVSEKAERSEVINMKEDSFVAMDTDLVPKENIIPENKDVAASSLNKRKLPEQEAVMSNEPTKRKHRWKTDSNMVKESQISNAPPTAAKDVPKSIIPKRNFLRSDSIDTNNNVKEREVPPSAKVATNSLRIDRFLRPFTLKAVQDLLSKTGTVTSFWMDHIKTHCYVTYKSVEEAVATRNAIYNLQWPSNGGRNLVADFVDPGEVKLRVEPPPPPPAPMSTAPTVGPTSSTLPKLSPRPQQNRMHQRLQQPALPPPPLLSNLALVREFAHAAPPPPEKVEGPTLTLDDLFKKTKATPRIYYLPLSEEQVSAILEQRKDSKL